MGNPNYQSLSFIIRLRGRTQFVRKKGRSVGCCNNNVMGKLADLLALPPSPPSLFLSYVCVFTYMCVYMYIHACFWYVNVCGYVNATSFAQKSEETLGVSHLCCLRQGLIFTAVYIKLLGQWHIKDSFPFFILLPMNYRWMLTLLSLSGFQSSSFKLLYLCGKIYPLSNLPSPLYLTFIRLAQYLCQVMTKA